VGGADRQLVAKPHEERMIRGREVLMGPAYNHNDPP
jgi:hypothetical protein